MKLQLYVQGTLQVVCAPPTCSHVMHWYYVQRLSYATWEAVLGMRDSMRGIGAGVVVETAVQPNTISLYARRQHRHRITL